MFYDKYVELCAKKGMTPSAAAKEIGINKAAVSNWKYRKNGPSDITAQKIADYFNVSVDYLLTGEEKETAYTNTSADGEDPIAAFMNGIGEGLTNEERQAYWDDAREYIAFKIAQHKGKTK